MLSSVITFLAEAVELNNSDAVLVVLAHKRVTILGLSLSDYRLPIALKLEVGDIGVTVSRESLDYSEATIKMLKKKLELAKEEIIKFMEEKFKTEFV